MSNRKLSLIPLAAALALSLSAPTQACTSLTYTDANGSVYLGRTLELSADLPYQLLYVPAGHAFRSQVPGQRALTYEAKYPLFGVTMPDRLPTADSPLGVGDLKLMEGFNNQGLTFSLLAYPSAAGPQDSVAMTRRVLSALDLGSWILAQHANVDEVKQALTRQTVMLAPLAAIGGALPPFHYVVHDRGGASIVIEFNKGQMTVHDNPVGVMTNGPEFEWHLTNLNNYTFLSNLDQPTATFGDFTATQPDSGIATAGLPASNTSVGRFVRAVYYSKFAEKVDDPDAAVITLGRIMNNFDRPKGITIDEREGGGEHMDLTALVSDASQYSTEFTSWTNLTDLSRNRFHIRTYDSLNYTMIDLEQLSQTDGVRILPLKRLDASTPDGTSAVIAGMAP
ncbi:linear amide C-N hydrolase [Alkalisalibacterium limincola]|uniref:Linear amide C-N hydrolase n=1 Tax=Alkalisalibacterium limincola TaxID=2699169 RepID=A0A5C8KL28_9GAMM|nr:linear amide C-N hydrolase [Alkalisalibacterium limincola]TXK61027.1 linear amide C-N hydrolase [Alkalisalibacterium limincola]